MVQAGKCETCRSRKVKCDEAKPICAQCVRSHRHCSYPERKCVSGTEFQPENLSLAIRNVQRVKPKKGTFLKLGRWSVVQTYEPLPMPLSNDSTQLTTRWVRMLQFVPSISWAHTTACVPSYLGADRTLDAAAAYMFDSTNAWLTQKEGDVHRACASGNRAMLSLRGALLTHGVECSDHVLLSIQLMLLAQYLTDVRSNDHQIHAIALSRMLKQRCLRGRWGQMEEDLARKAVVEETGASIFAGVESDMDQLLHLPARRLTLQSQSHSDKIIRATSVILSNLIPLPRLVLKVRRLAEGAHNSDPYQIHDTLALAQQMYNAPGQSEIETLMETESTEVPATTNPLGRSLEYTSEESFSTSIMYCMSRIAICALVLRTLDLVEDEELTSRYFDRRAVGRQDLKLARRIAMSTEFAHRERTGPPFPAMRICTPLMISTGAWRRLLARRKKGGREDKKSAVGQCSAGSGDDDNDDAEQEEEKMAALAEKVQQFILEAYHRSMRKWRYGCCSRKKLEQMCDAFSGGPTLPEYSRKT